MRHRTVQLFFLSFLALYAELVCIRWIPAYVRFVAYFTNFILLASFLGLGAGILSARRRLPLGPGLRVFPWLLLAYRAAFPLDTLGVSPTGRVTGAIPTRATMRRVR